MFNATMERVLLCSALVIGFFVCNVQAQESSDLNGAYSGTITVHGRPESADIVLTPKYTVLVSYDNAREGTGCIFTGNHPSHEGRIANFTMSLQHNNNFTCSQTFVMEVSLFQDGRQADVTFFIDGKEVRGGQVTRVIEIPSEISSNQIHEAIRRTQAPSSTVENVDTTNISGAYGGSGQHSQCKGRVRTQNVFLSGPSGTEALLWAYGFCEGGESETFECIFSADKFTPGEKSHTYEASYAFNYGGKSCPPSMKASLEFDAISHSLDEHFAFGSEHLLAISEEEVGGPF